MDVVDDLCGRFGGDRNRVVLTVFSRGAIACGFIGLRNDRIAGLWRGFHCCQHYDGDGWNGATMEGAVERARRFRGVAVFHTDNPAGEVQLVTDALGVPTTFASSGLGAHSCAMFLDDRANPIARPAALCLRHSRRPWPTIPPGVVHAYRNVSDIPGWVFNAPNRLYAGQGKQEPVDEIRHELAADSPYKVDDARK